MRFLWCASLGSDNLGRVEVCHPSWVQRRRERLVAIGKGLFFCF